MRIISKMTTNGESGKPQELANVIGSESERKKGLTMSKKRNRYIPELKAKIALAALKNGETISKLDGRFGVHPSAKVDA